MLWYQDTEKPLSSKSLKFCYFDTVNIFDKVSKETVDNSRLDTALLCLTFEATLKADQKLSDLELTFKGMREEKNVFVKITSFQLQSMLNNTGMIYNNIC